MSSFLDWLMASAAIFVAFAMIIGIGLLVYPLLDIVAEFISDSGFYKSVGVLAAVSLIIGLGIVIENYNR